MKTYLVFADGAGEYDLDFQAVLVQAETPRDAAEWAAAPEQGYGADNDGTLVAIPVEHAYTFSINPTTRRVLEPSDAAEVFLRSDERASPAAIPVAPRYDGKPLRTRRKKT